MNPNDFRRIVIDNAPLLSGQLRGAIRFQFTPMFNRAVYDLSAAEHIYYQELGFIHWISKRFIDKNQYFIQNKTVGALERFQMTNTHQNIRPDEERLNAPKNALQTGRYSKQRG